MGDDRSFIIIGGGPAGLTAAYELVRHGHAPVVLEQSHTVGGMARTERYNGYCFDMGGHRFFTKSEEVNRLWRDVLADEFLHRPRLSRIFYRGKFFHYPLKPLNALAGLGLLEGVLIFLSYVRWRLFPYRREDTFEQWVTNRFGRRLFETFFKSYTEKVWGIPCSELKAEWAAQRIKDLSLWTALMGMFLRPRNTIKTLIDSFHYPRQGPGMLWAAVRRQVEAFGGEVRLDSPVTAIRRRGNVIESVTTGANGTTRVLGGTDFISSMPVTEFIRKLEPPPPPEVLAAAAQLRYRDFLTVCLIVDAERLFPDNWIYVHDPSVKVGRIQNFKNWSPDMVPDGRMSSLGLEYFCNEGDDLWATPDADLIELGKRELERIGLARADQVVDGCVFRVPKSYPVYDGEYARHLAVVRQFMDGLTNCRTIGRNGLHRYNNQDHSMLTGLYAVRNLLFGQATDLWSVNADREYHEEMREPARERRPARTAAVDSVAPDAADDADALLPGDAELAEELAPIFAKVDRRALAVAAGAVCGASLLLLTLHVALTGNAGTREHLGLLAQYFPGFRVSIAGSLLALAYGFAAGGLAGWLAGGMRNLVMFAYWVGVRHRAERGCLRRLLEFV